jgi:hypothetical protein
VNLAHNLEHPYHCPDVTYRNGSQSLTCKGVAANHLTMTVAGCFYSFCFLLFTAYAQTLDPKLVGTWATKANSTLTGLVRSSMLKNAVVYLLMVSSKGFYNPGTDTLIEPLHTGVSYSFTDDGHFEAAWYRAIANREFYLPFLRRMLTARSSATVLSPGHSAVAARDIQQAFQWLAPLGTVHSGRQAASVRSMPVRKRNLYEIQSVTANAGKMKRHMLAS